MERWYVIKLQIKIAIIPFILITSQRSIGLTFTVLQKYGSSFP